MGKAVKRTISLPSDLASEVDAVARDEGKTLSAVIQDALRLARVAKLNREFSTIQGYWAAKAKQRGILTEKDLQKFLKQ